MYAMGLLDTRIRPFIYLVRQWAKEFGITRYNQKQTFTNFQLSYMCMSFLKQLNEPLIPTYEQVRQYLADKEATDPMFIFNIDQIPFTCTNTSTVLELFQQFLDYYGAFEFDKYVITLRANNKLPMPQCAPVYLDNMFNPANAWGLNVAPTECNSLKIMAQETLQELSQCSTQPDHQRDWGLLEILSKLK